MHLCIDSYREAKVVAIHMKVWALVLSSAATSNPQAHAKVGRSTPNEIGVDIALETFLENGAQVLSSTKTDYRVEESAEIQWYTKHL